MEDLSQLPEAETQFLARLGEMLMAWNTAESWMQGLLLTYMGRDDKMQVLTAHLSSLGLTEALRTIAADFSDPVRRPYITHATEFFDRLREYRNYYAHGAQLRWPDAEGPRAYLHQATARGRFALSQTFIRTADVERFILQCEELSRYLSALVTMDDQAIVRPPMEQPRALELPPMPERPQKPKMYPRQPRSTTSPS